MNIFEDRYYERYLLQHELDKILSAKKEKDLLEDLIARPELIEIKPEKPAEPISEFFWDKIDGLRKKIDHLNKEISSRFQMKEKFQKEIDYQIQECAFSLKQFQFWGLGYNRGVDMKRNLLERQLANLRKERRGVELRTWEDIISLRKELRNALEEYKAAVRRYRMVE